MTVSPLRESADPIDFVVMPWNWFIFQISKKSLMIVEVLWSLMCLGRSLCPQQCFTEVFINEIPSRAFGSPHLEFYLSIVS